MTTQDKNKQQSREDDAENGLHHTQPNAENSFLSGIKQRLLSFIFREIWNEESDNTMVCSLLANIFFTEFHKLCIFNQCIVFVSDTPLLLYLAAIRL